MWRTCGGEEAEGGVEENLEETWSSRRSYLVPLEKNLTGVCVEGHKLVGVLDPDWSPRLLCLHPLRRKSRRRRSNIGQQVSIILSHQKIKWSCFS